ncbi:transposase [Streptomyces sp. NWU49]|uniref:transposase n=1 Tax=Streptomyces sp. NWU49 TaxID=2201153 RepID=UPI0035C05C94
MGVIASGKWRFDAEFRKGAVRIVTEAGKPIPEVTRGLGINPATLHIWVSRTHRTGSPTSDRVPVGAAGPVASGTGRLRETERAELERLRAQAREKGKRIRKLEVERDVCKRWPWAYTSGGPSRGRRARRAGASAPRPRGSRVGSGSTAARRARWSPPGTGAPGRAAARTARANPFRHDQLQDHPRPVG